MVKMGGEDAHETLTPYKSLRLMKEGAYKVLGHSNHLDTDLEFETL